LLFNSPSTNAFVSFWSSKSAKAPTFIIFSEA
jgi:hypothetical protein